jgi:hypothetical protein
VEVEAMELWLCFAACPLDCCARDDDGVYDGLMGWCAVEGVGGKCAGGITSEDFDRLRDAAARDRLCDRPRIREVMALKNDTSAGEFSERELREKVEVGESISGEALPAE